MAKRIKQAEETVRVAVDSSMPTADALSFVLFQVAGEMFAFPLSDVIEIIRVPTLTHMPLAPESLLGLANQRGTVLPIVSLGRIIKSVVQPLDDDSRVIVVGQQSAVGFVADRIVNLRAFPGQSIKADKAGNGAIDSKLVARVIVGLEGESTIKVLDSLNLLERDFASLSAPHARGMRSASIAMPSQAKADVSKEDEVELISFLVAGQEYGLPLEGVREIIPMPANISEVAGSETAVLGVVTLRNSLLPLVSLRALLGLPGDQAATRQGKVLVARFGSNSVGVVVDGTREILRVNRQHIDDAPALLTRGEGEAEIVSVCRLAGGKRLVAVLATDRLFRSELVSRVLADHGEAKRVDEQEGLSKMADAQFVIFRLGDQEYGISVTAIAEIARPPDKITKMPKTPSFVDGVFNLRGGVVPVIDVARRFEIARATNGASQRILVLSIKGVKTGLLVDGVSEIARIPSESIQEAPALSDVQTKLISRVANMPEQERLVLIVDPEQLLNQIEVDMLLEFNETQLVQKSTLQ